MKLYILIMACLLSACMGTTVEVDKAYSFDPQRYRSYAWLNEPMEDSAGRQLPIVRADAILRAELNRQLQSMGYREVARDSADFFLDYRLTQTIKQDRGGVISPTDEAAASWDTGSDPNNTRLYNHSINAYILHSELTVLMTNGASETLWQATARKLLDNESPSDDALRSSFSKIIGKMLRAFPSQG